MRTDSDYSRSWHDLRRREFLYWFFVLSYVPGILLVIVLLNAFEPHLPEHLGVYFSIIWLAGFAWTAFTVRVSAVLVVITISFVDLDSPIRMLVRA